MSQLRNLHPTPEAVFAHYHWHARYAAQRGGTMDFYDAMSASEQRYCDEAVKAIIAVLAAPVERPQP